MGSTPKPIADGEETDYEASIAPDQFPGDEVPECPPRSDDEGELQPAAVTRQLPRAEVLSCEDAIAAIKKEFDGIGAMGTWDLDSVEEEDAVRKRALATGQTIHLADLLVVWSEKHVELEPQYRTLKRKSMLQRRSSPHREGQLGVIPNDECLASIDHCSKCHHSSWHAERPQDHIGRCGEGLSPRLTQFSCGNLVATPKGGVARVMVWQEWSPTVQAPGHQAASQLIYGHPEAGAHLERKLEQELLDMGAIKVPEFPSTYTFQSYGNLGLVVYVDDFLLCGDRDWYDASGLNCQNGSWSRTSVTWVGFLEDTTPQ